MAQRREIESRLSLYGELADILGAMRSFALTELRRVAQREESQRKTVDVLSQALGSVAHALVEMNEFDRDIQVIFGTVRGFCGSFNEDLVASWKQNQRQDSTISIVVGERLASLFPPKANVKVVPGAVNATDALSVIESVLEECERYALPEKAAYGLSVTYRDDHGVQSQRLLPLSRAADFARHAPPFTYEPPPQVALGVLLHYLFHRLLHCMIQSLRVENHMRLIQMENALRHIDENTADLNRKRNQLRQEEIVEEIELILGER